jgi:hypothetical protein
VKKVPGQQVHQRIVQPVYSPVFFPKCKIIFNLVVLGIDTACYFIGDAEKLGAVKAIIVEKKP